MSELATRFYIDDLGFLWSGPADDQDGKPYQRFEGISNRTPQWSRHVALPLTDFEETTVARAWKIIERYLMEDAA